MQTNPVICTPKTTTTTMRFIKAANSEYDCFQRARLVYEFIHVSRPQCIERKTLTRGKIFEYSVRTRRYKFTTLVIWTDAGHGLYTTNRRIKKKEVTPFTIHAVLPPLGDSCCEGLSSAQVEIYPLKFCGEFVIICSM